MTLNFDNLFAKFTEYTRIKNVEVKVKQKQFKVEKMKANTTLAKIQLNEYAILSKDTLQIIVRNLSSINVYDKILEKDVILNFQLM